MIINEIKVLENKKDKLLDLALDGLLSKEELKKKKEAIEKEISSLNAKLKELETKKINTKQKETYNKTLKENILKELEITRDNLEVYIEELLDKIIVEETEDEDKVTLKIILAGNEIIKHCSPTKPRQVGQIKENKVADFKKLPLCQSLAHGNHLFSSTRTFFKKSVHVKCNSRKIT